MLLIFLFIEKKQSMGAGLAVSKILGNYWKVLVTIKEGAAVWLCTFERF